MRVAIGSDHAGYELKQVLAAYMKELGHDVKDMGTHSTDPVDYPDFAEAVSREIVEGRADRGIILCGSGVGASVVANKVPGIRAGISHDTYSAHQGVEHDDVNVLVVGARIVGVELAKEITRAFLAAEFSKEERHRRRLDKVIAIEKRYLKGK
jgi:RpiB/LacA/LacB family sugar-phosphate isomerase